MLSGDKVTTLLIDENNLAVIYSNGSGGFHIQDAGGRHKALPRGVARGRAGSRVKQQSLVDAEL